jgi:hypothetical protein
MSLYVRIMTCPEESQQTSQLEHLLEVLRVLVTPDECQHVLIERYFDDVNRSLSDYHPCEMYCSFCTGSVYCSVGKIRKAAFYSFLVGHFLGKTPTPKSLMKLLREKVDNMFEPDSVPKSSSGWQGIGPSVTRFGNYQFRYFRAR